MRGFLAENRHLVQLSRMAGVVRQAVEKRVSNSHHLAPVGILTGTGHHKA